MKVPLVKFQRLVGRRGRVVEVLAACGSRSLVCRAVNDQNRRAKLRHVLFQPVGRLQHLGSGFSRLRFLANQRIVVHGLNCLRVA